METKDLRIGNYVEISGYERIVIGITSFKELEVVGLDCIDPEYCTGQFFEATDCEGIKLTEQWLKDFGFIKHSFPHRSPEGFLKDMYLSKDHFAVTECKDEFYFPFQNNINGEDTYLKIGYVHTLQNLYFALKSEELSLEVNNNKQK